VQELVLECSALQWNTGPEPRADPLVYPFWAMPVVITDDKLTTDETGDMPKKKSEQLLFCFNGHFYYVLYGAVMFPYVPRPAAA